MKSLGCLLGATMVAASVLVAAVRAEEKAECKLELVRMKSESSGDSDMFQVLRSVTPQTFYMQIHKGAVTGFDEQAFKKTVTKEPAKYVVKHPLRGTASLGSKKYGFVVDKKEEKSREFDRLYFDLNGNGDLSDDKPIDKPPPPKVEQPSGVWALLFTPQPMRAESAFPRVDLTIDVEGKKLDYSFFFEVDGWGDGDEQYVWAMLRSGVYRQGALTLDGKNCKLILLDYNSNGRFNDLFTLPKDIRRPDNELSPESGDLFVIEPRREGNAAVPLPDEPLNPSQHMLAKLIILQDKYYTNPILK